MIDFFPIEIGFPELSQDDQLILIKIGFFEVWLGHVSRLINSQEGTMTLTDGVTLSKQQIDLIFDVILFFVFFFVFFFIEKMNFS